MALGRSSFPFVTIGTVALVSVVAFVIIVSLGAPAVVPPGAVIPPTPTVAVYLVQDGRPRLWSTERPVRPGDVITLSVAPAGRDRVAVVVRDAAGRAEVLHDEPVALRQQAAMIPVAWAVPARPAPAELVVLVGAEPMAPSDAEAALDGRARGAGAWLGRLRFVRAAAPSE